jgi:molybdate transport system substrate-binding protein
VAAAPSAALAGSFVVFAAASLKESLDDVAAAWRGAGRGEARIAYGASSALARQVDAGAPAELFLSADLDWIDWLAKRKRLSAPPTRLLANELVLMGNGRLALADPRAVPAGRYARAALESLGAWKGVEARLAPAGDVRAALALVARGEAPLGIVYRTDALAEPRVRVVGAFPEASHPPIVYGMALLAGATPDARAFADYAASAPARAIWARHGFRFP